MRATGKILTWNHKKGYGFIQPSGGGKRVFVHITEFSDTDPRPKINQAVIYELSTDKQGRPCAVNATLKESNSSQISLNPKAKITIIAVAVILLVVGIFVFTSKGPPLILGIYLVASLITFVVYAMDKLAAKNGRWRTPESTLHLLALVGGWPGGLAAQKLFRHKSSKPSFQAVFWVTVVVNCGMFVWLLTPEGVITLQSLLTS